MQLDLCIIYFPSLSSFGGEIEKVHMQVLSHTCTICYHTEFPASLHSTMQKHCNLNAIEAVLEITVKMDYNNIRLLWQRKLRLWVSVHLHEPVSVPALTGHGDLFNFPTIIIAQQFPMCNNFVFFCLSNCMIMGLGLNYSRQAIPLPFYDQIYDISHTICPTSC
jgi:hypothetical protein